MTQVRLTVAIAHHPARSVVPLVDRLLDAPTAVPVYACTDPEPGRLDAWVNARRAWASALEPEIWAPGEIGTHHLVLEDDIVVCKDFLPTAERAIAARPGACVRFYSPAGANEEEAREIREARARGERWAPVAMWSGAQAVALPTPWIENFLQWAGSYPELGPWPDSRLREWLRARAHAPAWTTVPSLVEHGQGESLAGSPPHRASCFIGEDVSALELDW